MYKYPTASQPNTRNIENLGTVDTCTCNTSLLCIRDETNKYDLSLKDFVTRRGRRFLNPCWSLQASVFAASLLYTIFNDTMTLLIIIVSFAFIHQGLSQDIVYPKDEIISYLSGDNPAINERIPIYIPGRCAENMLLYPGAGDKSYWSCDCRPGFLYFPLNETCHEAFRQGPCPAENYVYKPLDDAVPICANNPCKIDGFVLYNGICQEIGANCNGRGVIRVNKTTFQLECTLPRA
ncbi:uncharacterized protein [Venturia canescens]|uniref:uncharacterized protein n=1 Tax=Venturia canescens TaxID=32260 RepID=UPI001C9C4E53|nr:uncharacterized protein LOC122409775 [Venturia canescens]